MNCVILAFRSVQSFFEHPWAMLLLTAVVFAVTFWLYFRAQRSPYYNMDPGGRHGEFERHLVRFQDFAKLVVTLTTASVAFLINFLASPAPEHPGIYGLRLRQAGPAAITLLSLSAVCDLLFMLCENLFYEGYTHAKFPAEGETPTETYSRVKYAWNLALAATGLLCFLFTFLFLALELFA